MAMIESNDDSTFDLNLAPMLDIIVSIVPMLLMSLAFVQVTMIETPVPQAVEKAMQEADKRDDLPKISLAVSSVSGFTVEVEHKGKTDSRKIALKGSGLDFDGLHAAMVELKLKHPDAFRLELLPDEGTPLESIVLTMDRVRNRAKTDPPLFFNDVASGKQVETDLIFPDVVFGDVTGGAQAPAKGG